MLQSLLLQTFTFFCCGQESSEYCIIVTRWSAFIKGKHKIRLRWYGFKQVPSFMKPFQPGMDWMFWRSWIAIDWTPGPYYFRCGFFHKSRNWYAGIKAAPAVTHWMPPIAWNVFSPSSVFVLKSALSYINCTNAPGSMAIDIRIMADFWKSTDSSYVAQNPKEDITSNSCLEPNLVCRNAPQQLIVVIKTTSVVRLL